MKRLPSWVVALLGTAVATGIFALAFVAFYFVGASPLTATERYPVLRDLLAIVIAASALIIGLIGTFTFVIVRREMQRDVEQEVRDRYMGAIAAALTSSAHSFYLLYRENHDAAYLQAALDLAQTAHNDYTGPLVRSKNLDYVRLVCEVRNNIAAYVAEKCRLQTASPGERLLAREYAKFLEERLVDYNSKLTSAWSETIEEVRTSCPSETTAAK